jgi:hypothetical protein
MLIACFAGLMFAMTEVRQGGTFRAYNVPACFTFMVPAFLVIYLWDLRWWVLLLLFGLSGLVCAICMGMLANWLYLKSEEAPSEIK